MNRTPDPGNRLAYLEAIGIDVWLPRGEADESVDPAETLESPEAMPVSPAAADAVEMPVDWQTLRDTVAACVLCDLHRSRTQTVFGVGNTSADWMIVGEAPGAEEDRRGEPFVGRAGKLLDEILRSVGLDRDSVFIANILKCRPPNNRDPAADEAASCRGYLDRQIALVQPKMILAVGRIAAQQLLDSDQPVGRMRGRVYETGPSAIPTVVTYHPAYLLRSPSQKSKVWQDLCLARRSLRQ